MPAPVPASAETAVRIVLIKHDPNCRIRLANGPDGLGILEQRESERKQWKNFGNFNVSVCSNAHGLRSKKNSGDFTSDTVLFLGDSFSFGWGVEQNNRYSDLVGSLTHIKTFNISVPTDIHDS